MANIEIVGDKKIWLELCNKVLKIKNEVFFQVKDEGIHIREVDDGHISLLDIVLSSSAFDKFRVPGGNAVIGVNAWNLKNFLDLLGEKITFLCDGKNIILSDEKKTATTSIIDGELYKEVSKIDLKLDFEIKLSADDLDTIIKTAKLFEKIKFEVKKKGFYISASSDGRFFESMLSKKVKSLTEAKSCSSLFNSDYLVNILDIIKKYKNITLTLGQDTILKIEGKNEKDRAYCLLAPCIES